MSSQGPAKDAAPGYQPPQEPLLSQQPQQVAYPPQQQAPPQQYQQGGYQQQEPPQQYQQGGYQQQPPPQQQYQQGGYNQAAPQQPMQNGYQQNTYQQQGGYNRAAPQQPMQNGYQQQPYGMPPQGVPGNSDPLMDVDLQHARFIMSNGICECGPDAATSVLVFLASCFFGCTCLLTGYNYAGVGGNFLLGCCCWPCVCGISRRDTFVAAGAADQDPGLAIDCLVHACITSVCAITQEYAAVQHIKKAAMRGVVVRQQAMANSPTM